MRGFSLLTGAATTATTATAATAAMAAVLALGGCGSSLPQAPLLPSAFRKEVPTTAPAKAPSVPGVPGSATVSSQAPLSGPPTAPFRRPAPLFDGQYQTVGAVVSEVNGNPIYANEVIRQLRGELSARAAEMDEEQFRKFAGDEIADQIERMQRAELIFGAAERNLDDEEKRLAEMLTMQFRTRKITEAGGSAEMAQRKAEAEGQSFDAMVYEQYRRYMSDVYMRKKVYPRIQVSANDMRAYYNRHLLEQPFTQLEEITFRLIRIDTAISGGREKAKARAQKILEKARSGDFAEIARMENDDQRLARSGGEETIQRGAYKLEKVEEAIWKLAVGQLSGLIEDTGGFYLAKVEAIKPRQVLAFEDPQAQSTIYKALSGPQFSAMLAELDENLRRNSMVRPPTKNGLRETMQPAVEMAMQNYAQWSGKTQKS